MTQPIRPIRGALLCGIAVPFALAAGPSAAQSVRAPDPAPGLCGQPAALSHTLTGALSAGFGSLALDLSLPRTEPAYLEFRLAEAADVSITARAQNGGDPYITLFDLFGGQVAFDDDSGGDFDSLLSQRLEAGGYCLQVRPLGADPDPARFLLTLEEGLSGRRDAVAGACTDPSTPDLATLSPGFGRASLAGQHRSDASYFRLSLTEPLAVQIDAESADFDTVLAIFDADGNWVTENDDGPVGTDSRIAEVLPAGDLCVELTAFSGGTGAFQISLAPPSDDVATGTGDYDAAACTNPDNTIDFGTLDAGGLSASGTLSGTPETYVQVFLPEPADLRIALSSRVFDTYLYAYDATGGLLHENDDGPTSGTDSVIEARFPAGTLCLGVAAFGEGSGAFDIEVALPGDAASAAPGGDAVAIPGPDSGIEIDELGTLTGIARSTLLTGERMFWAAFELDAPGVVQIDTTSLSGSYDLHLINSGGDIVDRTDGSGPLNAARLSVDLESGRFYVVMDSGFDSESTLIRQVIVTLR